MRLLRYLIGSTPAFLAFILAPYFFLLGATYDDERLKLLNLSDAGMSPSGANAIYRGFNIWANTSLPSLVTRLLLFSLISSLLLGFLWWLSWSKWKQAKRLRARGTLARRKARAAFRWAMFDTGLIIAPALGVVVWVILTSLFIWLLGNMDDGVKAARNDIKILRKAVPTCNQKGVVPSGDCSTVLFANKECITGVVAASNADRLAIIDETGSSILRDNKSVVRFIKPSTSAAAFKDQCIKEKTETLTAIRTPVRKPFPKRRRRTRSQRACGAS